MTPDDPYDYLDDEDDPEEEEGFQCAAFWVGDEKTGGWYCPIAGTEDCDWECPDHLGR